LVPILSTKVHDEVNDLLSTLRRVRWDYDLDRVRLNMNNLIPTILNRLTQINHKQSATLRNNVILVTNIPERVLELGACQPIDVVDDDLKSVRHGLSEFRGVFSRRQILDEFTIK